MSQVLRDAYDRGSITSFADAAAQVPSLDVFFGNKM
jgi:hypothetical protein